MSHSHEDLVLTQCNSKRPHGWNEEKVQPWDIARFSRTLKCWPFGLPTLSSHVCPVQANLVVQENRHVLAMQDLQKAQAELDDKEAELDKVQAEYEQAMTEKQVIVVWLGRGRRIPTRTAVLHPSFPFCFLTPRVWFSTGFYLIYK